jgi:hypothetical protein
VPDRPGCSQREKECHQRHGRAAGQREVFERVKFPAMRAGLRAGEGIEGNEPEVPREEAPRQGELHCLGRCERHRKPEWETPNER